MPHDAGQSVGGWAACDACYELVNGNRRAELLRRAVEHSASGRFGAAGIAALHKSFWEARDNLVEAAGVGAALTDFLEGRMPPTKPVTERSKRTDAIKMLTGLTDDELDALGRGDLAYKEVAQKLVAWRKKYGTDYDSARRLAEWMEQEHKRPLPAGHVPHWQQAIDAQYDALLQVTKMLEGARQMVAFNEATDLNDPKAVAAMMQRAETVKMIRDLDFQRDAQLLRTAATYSFNAETTAAIREGANSIPHDAPLSSIETPNTGAGWFWFAEPLNLVASSVASNHVHALLWGWAHDLDSDGAVLRFSVYVRDENREAPTHQRVLPSTRWTWKVGESFHEMIARSTIAYREMYGPGGKFEGTATRDFPLDGEIAQIKVISELSLFFLMACVWFKQKVLVAASGHVERHARKRIAREHKLKEPPSVRVIALREALREPAPPSEESGAEKTTRHYQVRWIVRGHARLQVCGPARKDRKLIWIDAHPAGPSDKPLKVSTKVYAVIR
jgi:hypothetical protein